MLILPLQFAPALAAALVRGPLLSEGFRNSGARLKLNRQSIRIYGLAITLLPFLLVVAFLLGLIFHLATWQPDASQASSVMLPSILFSVGLAGGVILTMGLSIAGALLTLGEEFGWRGYLLPCLMPLGQNPAIILSGVIWACWHLPLNLLYGANGGLKGFPLFLVSTIGLGTVLGWLRLRSASVWPAAIMHSQIDVLPRLEGVLLVMDRGDPVFVILQLQVMIVGLVLALRKSLTRW